MNDTVIYKAYSEARNILQEFKDRVENGEVRSKYTYKKICDHLKEYDIDELDTVI